MAALRQYSHRAPADKRQPGIGDFEGLMRRLDYMLGVSAVWLMPFQKSPRLDDGYDVSDHYNVDSRYGSLGDFVEFATPQGSVASGSASIW